MIKPTVVTLAVVCLGSAVASAQGVAIDHKQVGCIVAGKYPKMDACVTPSADFARGRVYFRPEATTSWYYVDMRTDVPCLAGILPKPSKKLVGKKIEYYLEAQDKAFNSSRTAEYAPVVVEAEGECDKDVPVAPFLTNANVVVFPALPAGFAVGGIGAATTAAVVAGGAAVVGTTAAVVAASNDDTTTTTVVIGGNTTTTVAATTTTIPATTTTTVPSGNRPPFAVLTANPTSGVSPLTVTFNLCASTDPDGDPLSYFFNFGDGVETGGACEVKHTYVASSLQALDVRSARAIFNAQACVSDPRGAAHCRDRTIDVQPPPQPTTTTTTTLPPCPAPTVAFTAPPDGSAHECQIDVASTTTNAVAGQFCFEELDTFGCTAFAAAVESGTAAVRPPPTCVAGTAGPGGSFTATLTPPNFDCYRLTARAQNACGNQAPEDQISVFFFPCSAFRGSAGRARSNFTWSSDLSLEGGRMQVVANGGPAAYPTRGRSLGIARFVEGENRIEAQVVEAAGRAGLWRVDLKPEESILAGTLRAIAGDVVSVSSTSITFRLSGQPGQRVVFTFYRK